MVSIDLKDASYSIPVHKTTKPTDIHCKLIFEIFMYAK